MRFDENILSEIKARIPVSQVVSATVKLKRQGREFIGLSPFKNEKTPSFTVNDHKGFYHCFASGEHGDIFSFLMKIEGLSFPEAVEKLAGIAGVALPQPTEQDREKSSLRQELIAIHEKAAAYFVDELRSVAGREAREYLIQRGIDPELQKRFRIGYAPGNRTALKTHLREAGFKPESIAQSGLVIAGEDIAVPYDRFRHRVMFPITNLKNEVIAFGGRALSEDQPAKYLNSPETLLFHKGSVLFNLAPARQPAFDSGTILIVEGYMDVIALAGAGFNNAVAPLGTAVTDNQLRLLWRMASEPVFCLDGDSAGRKAAYRAVETALPHLEPGKSARFVFLPDGQDPDDIVQDQGAEFFRQLLDRSQPLSEVLWQKEWEAGVWDTPERRADLEARLNAAVRTIQNGSVKSHYEADIRSRLFAAWRDSNRQRYDKKSDKTRNNRYGGRGQSVAGRQKNWNSSRAANSLFQARNHLGGGASTSLTQSVLVKEQKLNASTTEALLISFLFHHPWLLDEFVEEISAIKIENSRIEQLRDAFLSIHAEHHPVDREVLNSQLSLRGLDAMLLQILQSIPGKSTLSDDCEAGSPEVRDAWHRLMNEIRRMSLTRELDTAGKSMGYDISEEEIDRITNISRELQDLENR